eukprot:291794-Chlamydomonas_euryale.AAC.5
MPACSSVVFFSLYLPRRCACVQASPPPSHPHAAPPCSTVSASTPMCLWARKPPHRSTRMRRHCAHLCQRLNANVLVEQPRLEAQRIEVCYLGTTPKLPTKLRNASSGLGVGRA